MKTARELQWEANRIKAQLIAEYPDLRISDIRITISGRLTSSAGKACIQKREISISLPFYASEENFRTDFFDTVTHEIAHILAPPIYENNRWIIHGRAWRAMHRRLGGNGKRCHNLDMLAASKRARNG